mmetsp:Transcript_7697/g.12562  ORF Transcript_7697/g.12562 Transcript_7697/m.12562 type:complete len:82 (-) Transcript_7697:33-278(-)
MTSVPDEGKWPLAWVKLDPNARKLKQSRPVVRNVFAQPPAILNKSLQLTTIFTRVRMSTDYGMPPALNSRGVHNCSDRGEE